LETGLLSKAMVRGNNHQIPGNSQSDGAQAEQGALQQGRRTALWVFILFFYVLTF
jgi:hypothetical protein